MEPPPPRVEPQSQMGSHRHGCVQHGFCTVCHHCTSLRLGINAGGDSTERPGSMTGAAPSTLFSHQIQPGSWSNLPQAAFYPATLPHSKACCGTDSSACLPRPLEVAYKGIGAILDGGIGNPTHQTSS